MNPLIEKSKQIKCLICDIDGVLTDGRVYIDNQGNECKAFDIQDGMGLRLLMAAKIEVAIITSANNTLLEHRMHQLGINHFYKGQIDKREAYQQLKKKLNLNDYECAYIGDDLPDLAIITQVGLGVAVANAVKQVREFAHWQTQRAGGRGAVREVCDLLLESQGKVDLALSNYLSQ